MLQETRWAEASSPSTARRAETPLRTMTVDVALSVRRASVRALCQEENKQTTRNHLVYSEERRGGRAWSSHPRRGDGWPTVTHECTSRGVAHGAWPVLCGVATHLALFRQTRRLLGTAPRTAQRRLHSAPPRDAGMKLDVQILRYLEKVGLFAATVSLRLRASCSLPRGDRRSSRHGLP